MKIVCFILLVTFCVFGKTEDPPKPAPPPASPVATPTAPAAASAAPPGASPVPGMSGLPALTNPLKPGATDSGSGTGLVAAVGVVQHGIDAAIVTAKKITDVFLGGPDFFKG